MKKVKFTLCLMLSFILMGASVSVNATDFIIVPAGSAIPDSITIAGASAGKDTVFKANSADPDTLCILDKAGKFVPITSVTIDSIDLSQAAADIILNAFREKKDLESLDFGGFTKEGKDFGGLNIERLDLSGFSKLKSLKGINRLGDDPCAVLDTCFPSDSDVPTIEPEEVPMFTIDKAMKVRTLSAPIYSLGAGLKILNLSGCSSLESLNCSGNQLSLLMLEGCTSLKYLNCAENYLQSVDLRETSVYVDSVDLKFYHQREASEINVLVRPDNPYAGEKGVVLCGKIKMPEKAFPTILKELTDAPDTDAPELELPIGPMIYPKIGGPCSPSSVGTTIVKVIRDEIHEFNIDWEIITESGNVLSSKGDERDGLAIEVQGSALKGVIVPFFVRSHYSYDKSDISIVSFGYDAKDKEKGGEEFCSVSFTGNEKDGSDKAGREYKFTMPPRDVKITLMIKFEGGGSGSIADRTIERTVKINSNGLETRPNSKAGFHYVSGHKNFTFTVYTEKEITVDIKPSGNSVLISDNGDGSWKVTITKISTNLEIWVSESGTSSGEVSNAAVAEGDVVWAANGILHVKPAAAGVVSVYNVTGQLCKQVSVSGDASFAMPKGFYILSLNGKVYKVKN